MSQPCYRSSRLCAMDTAAASDLELLKQSLTAGTGDVLPPGAPNTSSRFAPEHWRWQLRDDSYYAELCTFLCFCDDGSFVLANVAVISLGWAKKHQVNIVFKHTRDAAGASCADDCNTWTEEYGGSDLVVLRSGQGLQIGPHRVECLDESMLLYELELSFVKGDYHGLGGCEVRMRHTAPDLGFVPGTQEGATGWTYGGGEALFMGFAAPRTAVEGTVAYGGEEMPLEGRGFVSKNLTNLRADMQSTTAYHCKLVSDTTTLHLIQMLPPGHQTKGNRALVMGSIVHEGKLLLAALDGDSHAFSEDCGELDLETGYVPPTALGFRWAGKTLEETPREVLCEIRIETGARPMIRLDVLEHLPWLFRRVVQALFAKPFLYLYYQPAVEAVISIGDEKVRTTGVVLFEKHFVNPLT